MNKKACAYIRVSDERQDEYSPDSQRKRITAYAQQHGITLLAQDIFCDDGISARKADNRTAFQQMIARAKQPERPYDVILVWKFSRFARNQEESIVYKNLLRKIGVEVVSVSEPIADDPFGALIERIIEWMDEYYLINLSAEVRRGMTEKAGRGEAMGRAVFGYDRTEKSYVPNRDAPRVVQLFRDFCAGMPPGALAAELTAEGVRTSRGNAPSARWVRYLLQNPVYIGAVRWQVSGETPVHIARAHPAIVPEALYQQAQDRLQKQKSSAPRPRTAGDELFYGKIFCSACGAPLVRAGAHPPTMQCGRYARGRCTVSHSISCRKLQNAVFTGLKPVLEGIRLPVPALKREDDAWLRRQATAEARLKRAAAAYHNGVDTLDEYRIRKAQYLAELEECRARLQQLQTQRSGEARVWDLLQDETVAMAERKRLFSCIVERMVYQKAHQRLDIYLCTDKR